jgi:glutamine cyclotransferase
LRGAMGYSRAMRPASFFLLLCLACAPAVAQTCPPSRILTFKVEKEVRRSAVGFTEGLEMQGGTLLESTGDFFGETRINRIDPATGHVHTLMNAGKRYFGEGLTVFGGRLYQMTYTEHRVFVFDAQLRPLPELVNPREGWGLTHDATRLIASDGSSHLFFLSPKDFRTQDQITVTLDGREIRNLNELEYVDGAIWANVFEDWNVLKISPRTGCVEATADLRPLRLRMRPAERRAIDSDPNFIPNGIAHDSKTGLFTLTGKYWPVLFSGRFVEN